MLNQWNASLLQIHPNSLCCVLSNRLLLNAHSGDLIKMCESIITLRLDKYLPIEYFNECYFARWTHLIQSNPADVYWLLHWIDQINFNDCCFKWLPTSYERSLIARRHLIISKLKSNGRQPVCLPHQMKWIVVWRAKWLKAQIPRSIQITMSILYDQRLKAFIAAVFFCVLALKM